MRSLFLCLTLTFGSFSYAQSVGDTYQGIKSVSCEGEKGSLKLDIQAQTLTGLLINGESIIEFSNELLIEEAEETGDFEGLEVGLLLNFLESGIDLIGGPVVSADLTTFGTYAVVLETELDSGQGDYSVVYVEAMTGAQILAPMTCVFRQ